MGSDLRASFQWRENFEKYLLKILTITCSNRWMICEQPCKGLRISVTRKERKSARDFRTDSVAFNYVIVF